jgi:CHASE2 domain-containing sensor protein
VGWVASVVAGTWNRKGLRTKSPIYWLWTIFFVLLGFYLSFWLSQFAWWQVASNTSYNFVQTLAPARTTHPTHTAVVLIDDDDYWRGEWARRQPLKRGTLAKLLRAVSAANPRAIGIDIDLRCQTPDGRVGSHDDYYCETKKLFMAINDVAKNTPVVLAKTVAFDERLNKFVVDADLFDTIKFDPGTKVGIGYSRLPHDLRQVALNAASGGINLDSFATAISRVDPVATNLLSKRSSTELPYLRSFLSRESFAGECVTAGKVIAGDTSALSALASKIVIIGGDWHRDAWNRGDPIDEHVTPQGPMPGALIHANYIEAVISEQMTASSGDWLHIVFDLLIGLSLATIFACAVGYSKFLYLGILVLLIGAVSLVAWSNIGMFVDAAPLLILLSGHAAADKVIDWKRKADLHDRECGENT